MEVLQCQNWTQESDFGSSLYSGVKKLCLRILYTTFPLVLFILINKKNIHFLDTRLDVGVEVSRSRTGGYISTIYIISVAQNLDLQFEVDNTVKVPFCSTYCQCRPSQVSIGNVSAKQVKT